MRQREYETSIVQHELKRKFLCSDVESLLLIRQVPEVDVLKGKQTVILSGHVAEHDILEPSVKPNWSPSPSGVAKLNVDGERPALV